MYLLLLLYCIMQINRGLSLIHKRTYSNKSTVETIAVAVNQAQRHIHIIYGLQIKADTLLKQKCCKSRFVVATRRLRAHISLLMYNILGWSGKNTVKNTFKLEI